MGFLDTFLDTLADLLKEDRNMTKQFTILGETSSGKTCYLVGMYVAMTIGVEDYSISTPNNAEAKQLAILRRKLQDTKAKQDRFPKTTQDSATYNFVLNEGTERVMYFKWIDYPGEWTDAAMRPEAGDQNYEQYQQVERSINESSALFICMDGANLVGDDINQKIRRVQMNCALHISNYITNLFGRLNEQNKKLPPIGIIVTKWDLCRETTDEEQLRNIVKSVFPPIFNATDTVIAVIPVSIGDTITDNDCSGEFDPINVELPILYGIRYALEDSIKDDEENIRQNESACAATVADKESYISDKKSNIRRWQGQIDKEIADSIFFPDKSYINTRKEWINDENADINRAVAAINNARADRDTKNGKLHNEINRKRNRITIIKRALRGIKSAFYNGVWHGGIA